MDLRGSGKKYPIACEVVDLTLAYATNATTITKDIYINGTILDMWFTVPDLNAGTQCTLSLVNADSKEIDTSNLVDESTTHHFTPGISLSGCAINTINKVTVTIVTASAQIANRDFRLEIEYA